MSRKSVLAVVFAAGSIAVLAPLAAQAQIATIIREAPPPAVVEVLPAPRAGYVWERGHHEWRDGQYVWISGHWLPQRDGYAYREPQWQQRGDGSWVFIGGTWDRDTYADRVRRDDDDRYSARVEDPYGDRDGDGVPNLRDRHPDNPRRW